MIRIHFMFLPLLALAGFCAGSIDRQFDIYRSRADNYNRDPVGEATAGHWEMSLRDGVTCMSDRYQYLYEFFPPANIADAWRDPDRIAESGKMEESFQ